MNSFKNFNKSKGIALREQRRCRLVIMYKNFGIAELKKNNIDSGCFYLTNAYVHALEEGLSVAEKIHKILKQYGREE